MKNIIITLGAVLCFGLANAQTPVKEVLEEPKNPAKNTTPKVIEEVKEEAEIKRDVINKEDKDLDIQPRKDQIRTREHVKSTPVAERVTDTVIEKKSKKRSNKKRL